MFDIIKNKIQLSTDDLAIPPFKDFYNNAKDKQDALKKIEFIVWRYKWNSPYEAYPEKERTLYRDWETDRKSTRLNSSHSAKSRMPSSA